MGAGPVGALTQGLGSGGTSSATGGTSSGTGGAMIGGSYVKGVPGWVVGVGLGAVALIALVFILKRK
jgi:hypothetical protein